MGDFGAIGYGYRPRARYACDPEHSRGRLVAEPASATRTPFQRDRDRIIHSTAFRRLAHKTQVFIAHEGDHYRTRLTHTIEVSQIARALARALRLDEDLAEAIALAHDFGHTPFGHTGEDALNAVMADHGGFDHNAQSLRIVTLLEGRYAQFDGLNLTWETLEGLVKHNGPLTGRYARAGQGEVPGSIVAYSARHDLELDRFASLEAQVAAIADDIAYNTHDIDDGLRAGLFALEELRALDFTGTILSEIDARHPGLERARVAHELTRQQITRMVEDVISTSQRELAATNPQSADDVRNSDHTVVRFSEGLQRDEKQLKAFLFKRMYRHADVVEIRKGADRIVRELFGAYLAEPALMSGDWPDFADDATPGERARRVSDFVAGMTDTFALSEHRRLFDHTPDIG
jgi:dGTPase